MLHHAPMHSTSGSHFRSQMGTRRRKRRVSRHWSRLANRVDHLLSFHYRHLVVQLVDIVGNDDIRV